jgi:transposase
MSLYVGIDVSKAALDVAFGSDGDVVLVANDENGIGELAGQVVKAGPELVVLEATGGYEYLLAAALAAKEVPVAVVNPRQVRDFAKATGHWPRPTSLTREFWPRFAKAIRARPRPLPTPRPRNSTSS